VVEREQQRGGGEADLARARGERRERCERRRRRAGLEVALGQPQRVQAERVGALGERERARPAGGLRGCGE
jgi:hypothetical protein